MAALSMYCKQQLEVCIEADGSFKYVLRMAALSMYCKWQL